MFLPGINAAPPVRTPLSANAPPDAADLQPYRSRRAAPAPRNAAVAGACLRSIVADCQTIFPRFDKWQRHAAHRHPEKFTSI